MFRIFILVALCFLASCSLGSSQDVASNTISIETDAFTLMVPKTWTPPKTKDLPSPKKGTIALSLVSPEIKYGFANNLVILSDTLDEIMTSARYSELNTLQTSKNYLEYVKLQDQSLTFTDEETSKVTVFEARYNTTSPRMKFIQTARVCGSKVYLLHFSLALDKSADPYIELLKTFHCR